MAYRDFTKTSVWMRGFILLKKIYEVTRAFPKEERYVLTSDMKRAANSVLHNFAEGYGRYESRDKTRFYKIARGSAYEIMSQNMVAFELNYLEKQIQEDLHNGYMTIVDELDNLVISIEGR